MPTFQKCPNDVRELAAKILCQFESHKPLIDAGVKVDLLFAYCDRDDAGEPTNEAISHHGQKAYGLCRILGLKDRTMGRGDAEIMLDGDWWQETATEEQQSALLDHELHHVALRLKQQQTTFDNLGRPKLRLRKHDVQFGWFACIAERHGKNSIEQIQAASLMDTLGQFFWPALASAQPAKEIGNGKKKK